MYSDSETAEIISEHWVDLLVTHSATALIGYEWISNLEEEIKLFWNGKVTAATMLYFPIRYLVIAYWVMCYPEDLLRGVGYVRQYTCMGFTHETSKTPFRCNVYTYTMYVLQLLLFVCPALFSALRVYALTGQNKVVALITLFFSLGPVYANAVHYGWEKPEYDSLELLCGDVVAELKAVTALSRGLLSMGDLLVIVITVVKTIYVAKHSQGLVGSTSLASTLLYSGVIYYIPLALLNVVHMCMTVTGADQFLRTTSVVSILMDPVTSVLACRFLLNLRKFTPGSARSLPPFIASMGELVDFDFTNPEAPSTGGGSEELEITSTDSHAGDSANLRKMGSTAADSNEEGSRMEPGHTTEEVASPTSDV
ncbi:hypothetical protein V8D89_005516 [Ganoderma adspersum]